VDYYKIKTSFIIVCVSIIFINTSVIDAEELKFLGASFSSRAVDVSLFVLFFYFFVRLNQSRNQLLETPGLRSHYHQKFFPFIKNNGKGRTLSDNQTIKKLLTNRLFGQLEFVDTTEGGVFRAQEKEYRFLIFFPRFFSLYNNSEGIENFNKYLVILPQYMEKTEYLTTKEGVFLADFNNPKEVIKFILSSHFHFILKAPEFLSFIIPIILAIFTVPIILYGIMKGIINIFF